MSIPKSSSGAWGKRLRPWEQRAYETVDAPDSDVADSSDEESPLTPERSSEEFLNMLVSLKLSGKVSAKTACLLSYWAAGGGLTGAGSQLALPPTRKGGAFSEHFDRVIGVDLGNRDELIELDIPGHERSTLGRTVLKCDAALIYHQLAESVASSRSLQSPSHVAKECEKFGPMYHNHPVVQSEPPGAFLPLALYVDGVSFQKRDSAIGMWFVNLITDQRHLALVLRRRTLCRCGCKLWCSVFVAFQYIAWLIQILLSGVYPSAGPNGKPLEGIQRDFAGQSLGFRAATVCVKGDWAEYAHTFGLPQWSSHQHPCFACFCTGGSDGNMAVTAGISSQSTPWVKKTFADYNAACSRCEHRVHVQTVSQLRRLLAVLIYDKRKVGSSGRALIVDFPELNLEKGWRLAPSAELHDVGLLDRRCDCFPQGGFFLLFWDPTKQSMSKNRNPLFSESTCLGPEQFCADELHTMHLGVFQSYILRVLWLLIQEDVWHTARGLPEDAAIETCVLRLRNDLYQWYRAQPLANPLRPIYQLQDFGRSSIGSKANPILRAKAAESGSLLYFATDMCRRHVDILPQGRHLLDAGEALVTYMTITRSAGWKLSTSEQQGLTNAMLQFLTNRQPAGIPYKPKMHLFVHLVLSVEKHGNPRLVGTWKDESLNMQLANVCRSANTAVWHKRVLATFSHVRGPIAMKKPVRGET
jgi:hypothetical protein